MALRMASLAHSHFARLAAGGVTVTFALCVLINGAMVMGLAPVVGVPMPLLSYGGTVMITMMVGFALVLSVRVHRYSEVTSGKGALPLALERGVRRPHQAVDDARLGGGVAGVPDHLQASLRARRSSAPRRSPSASPRRSGPARSSPEYGGWRRRS